MGRKQAISEEMIDQTLADSFPASDPPAWTLGRERAPEKVQETDPIVIAQRPSVRRQVGRDENRHRSSVEVRRVVAQLEQAQAHMTRLTL